MISRRTWIWVCAALGLLLVAGGLLVPAHLRAVDATVLRRAGRKSPTLVDRGLALIDKKELGAAQLLLQAAQDQHIPGRQTLEYAVAQAAAQHPAWLVWGGGDYHLEVLFRPGVADNDLQPRALNSRPTVAEPFTQWAVREVNRATVLELLRDSKRPLAAELLRCRNLNNTAIFSPSQSSAGQALDAALAICGLLHEEQKLTPELSGALLAEAGLANRGGNSIPLEQALLDLMSLGQRFNWGQLAGFVANIKDTETLRLLAAEVRQSEIQLPVLFSAVQVSGQPAAVARYLTDFNQTGLKDLGATILYGTGGVNELLRRDRRLLETPLRQELATRAPFSLVFGLVLDLCRQSPLAALVFKWLLYFGGGFLLAMALHFVWPSVSALEKPLQVRGFHLAREMLFGLGFLLVVLLLSEPFLAQESQKAEFPFRLRLPMVGSTVPAATAAVHRSIMNDNKSLLPLLLFFVLQALLYMMCLLKLAEIRRQQVPARIKLKLLENEDHLFDAGLYLGFAGTIVSLILVTMNIFMFSFMSAYSSTSFGVIFVSIFKIFHLRPLRRKLLLEAEATYPEPATPAPAARPALAPTP